MHWFYKEAVKADKALESRLKELYGEEACEYRYMPFRWTDDTLKALAEKKRSADAKWINYMRYEK